jgi:acetylornithine deacetylase
MVDRDRLVRLASDLARIRSTRDKGEAEIGRFLVGYLELAGFVVDVQEILLDRFNVIARVAGDPAFHSIMLNGHLDMPTPVDGWKRGAFEPIVEDDWLYGAGLTDMKGGLAALVAGAEAAMHSLNASEHGEVIVTAVIHHDTIGLGTKYFLDANDRRIDAGINAEPTSLRVQLAHGGSFQFKVVVRGGIAHGSRQGDTVNAVEVGTEITLALRRDLLKHIRGDGDMPFLPRLVIGRIDGGTGAALTAAECVIEGDVRYPVTTRAEDVREVIDNIVAAHAPSDPRSHVSVYCSRYQRPFVSDPNWPIVRALVRAHHQRTGSEPELTKDLPSGAYITDASDMVRRGIPTVMYGPGDWRMIPDERISIHEMCTAAEVYRAVIMEWTTAHRD